MATDRSPPARRPLSPNHGPRRGLQRPYLVVLHYTAMTTAEEAIARLCSPEHEVSAHWLIDRQGEVVALVPEDRRAWHAGAGRWGGVTDINSASIGVELDNDGASPFPEPQMAALERLLAAIAGRWGIPAGGVIAHSDCAPGRKSDPGPRFDWRRLARSGRSVWPEAGLSDAPCATPFAASVARIGYPVGDAPEADILAAFRRRFRPWAEGPETDADRRAAANLAARHPARHGEG